jgi:hypothetical protein
MAIALQDDGGHVRPVLALMHLVTGLMIVGVVENKAAGEVAMADEREPIEETEDGGAVFYIGQSGRLRGFRFELVHGDGRQSLGQHEHDFVDCGEAAVSLLNQRGHGASRQLDQEGMVEDVRNFALVYDGAAELFDAATEVV